MNSWERTKDVLKILRENPVPSEWTLEAVDEYIKGLFSFSKFKAGDSVQMSETHPVSKEQSWGWWSYRHLLREGSKAVVRDVDWRNGTFVYGILFDENTWMDDKGDVRPAATERGLFYLSEKWLANRNAATRVEKL